MSRVHVEVTRIIGEWIRRELLSRGMAQKELARHARVSQASISNYVNGYKAPTVGTLLRILHALGYVVRIERRGS